MPPLSGFFAKLAILKAAFARGYGLVAALALAVGLLTLMSMTKVFNEAFWKEAPGREGEQEAAHWTALLPVAALAAMTISLGLAAGPAFSLAERAAAELLDPSAYIAAVRLSR
jgi:multicomponent Na+:H+ antiporter subunit D